MLSFSQIWEGQSDKPLLLKPTPEAINHTRKIALILHCLSKVAPAHLDSVSAVPQASRHLPMIIASLSLFSSQVWLRYSPRDKSTRKRTHRIPANFLTRTLSLLQPFTRESCSSDGPCPEKRNFIVFSLFVCFFTFSVQFRDLCVFFDAVASWLPVYWPRAYKQY